MSNFCGTSRTNYFKVTDEAAFAALAEKYSLKVIRDDKDDTVGLIAETDTGAWPWTWYDEDKEEDIEVDLDAEVGALLQDGQVAIFVTAGAEKYRYVSGFATAINNKGIRRAISIDDIFDLAKELTDQPESVTQPTY